jgi:hypothetical protein
MDPRGDDPDQPLVHNHIADQRGSAVQAGIVHGGVHIHPESVRRWSRRGLAWMISSVSVIVVGALIGTFVVLRGMGNPPDHQGSAVSGPPVSVVVQNDADPRYAQAVYALPAPLSPPPDSVDVGQQLADIVNGHGGVQVDQLQLTVVLTGQRTEPVTITGMRAVIDKREPTLSGAVLFAPSQGTADAAVGCIALGAGDAVIRVATPNSNTCAEDGPPYFAGHYISLAKDESSVVDCAIRMAASGYFEFELRMTVVAGGVTSEIPITEDGKPLRVTSYATNYAQAYTVVGDNLRQLERVDPATLNQGGNG